VKERLRALADGVLAGEVDEEAAAVASRILAVCLRAVEAERKVREQEDILERIDAFEQRSQGGRRTLLYSTTVSKALRQTLRGSFSKPQRAELGRIFLPRS
jgi:DNA replicative helicase MCM subunit Mcm2 (Cdc46/Mcm family)